MNVERAKKLFEFCAARCAEPKCGGIPEKAICNAALAILDMVTSSFDDGAAKVGGERMEFGKYRGQKVDDVPLDYLIAIAEIRQPQRIAGYLVSEAIMEEQGSPHGRHPRHRVAVSVPCESVDRPA